MLKSYSRQIDDSQDTKSEQESLQFLLFIDSRSRTHKNIQQIQNYLQSLKADYSFQLQVIELGQQPHLVEHLRLVATPALVKISPTPKQILAGSDLIAQLEKWWPRWQIVGARQCRAPTQRETLLTEVGRHTQNTMSDAMPSVGHCAEQIQLSDEIFRLKKEKEGLLEQLQFKDQVLAMLAHDLRSPLTAASIAVETLELLVDTSPPPLVSPPTPRVAGGSREDRGGDDKEGKGGSSACAQRHWSATQGSHTQPSQTPPGQLKEQLYKQAKSQFQIMNRMISDILQASKSMSAKLELQPRQLYLQYICLEVLSQFQNRLENKSQILSQDIPQDLPRVYGDEELLRQVIVNLLENAIKYTPSGGSIKFSILHRTTQKLQVSICNSGPGIPEEERERIFEGHFRLSRDEAKEGYGLGLALCRQILRAHYGQIWATASKNQGSCFHFTLPVYLS